MYPFRALVAYRLLRSLAISELGLPRSRGQDLNRNTNGYRFKNELFPWRTFNIIYDILWCVQKKKRA
jgi:hypothetical protein